MLNVGPPAQASSGQFPPTAVGLGPRSRALRAPKPRNEALMVRLHRLLALPTVVSASTSQSEGRWGTLGVGHCSSEMSAERGKKGPGAPKNNPCS